MGDSLPALLIEAGILLVQTITILATGIWKLGEVKDDLKEEMIEHRDDTSKEVAILRREVGETMTAFRNKITEVELYIRDTYVSKPTFDVNIERILTEVRSINANIDNRFIRMENEIKSLDRERSREHPQST